MMTVKPHDAADADCDDDVVIIIIINIIIINIIFDLFSLNELGKIIIFHQIMI